MINNNIINRCYLIHNFRHIQLTKQLI